MAVEIKEYIGHKPTTDNEPVKTKKPKQKVKDKKEKTTVKPTEDK